RSGRTTSAAVAWARRARTRRRPMLRMPDQTRWSWVFPAEPLRPLSAVGYRGGLAVRQRHRGPPTGMGFTEREVPSTIRDADRMRADRFARSARPGDHPPCLFPAP